MHDDFASHAVNLIWCFYLPSPKDSVTSPFGVCTCHIAVIISINSSDISIAFAECMLAPSCTAAADFHVERMPYRRDRVIQGEYLHINQSLLFSR